MIFLDSNIMIELLNDDRDERGAWSEAELAKAAREEELVCDLIVVAEVAAGVERPDLLLSNLEALSIGIAELDVATALRAAEAFKLYRRRGGPRETILPDFLIAAHAQRLGARLMSRDRRVASYFPDLVMIAPEGDR